MHPALLPTYEALERQTEILLAQLGALSDDQLHFRPDDATWSLAAMVEHLALVESGTAKALAQGLPESKRKPRLLQRLRAPLLKPVLRSRIRIKVPTRAVVPAADCEYGAACDHWRSARAALHERLEAFGAEDMGTAVFIHPVAGPLPPPKVVDFLNDHLAHHMHQVERLRDHPAFPAA